jgi:benzodiazapine receptor
MDRGKTRSLIVFLAICYAVAFIAGMMARSEIATWYAPLAKPTWSPPNWLFAPVGAILYGMIAVAGWKVWRTSVSRSRTTALWIFGLQLALNFVWSPVFFSMHRIAAGLMVIVSLAASLLLFILLTLKFQRTAAYLFVAYLLWVSFAAALNYTIWTMNANSESSGSHALTAVALRLDGRPDQLRFPAADAWNKATAIRFDRDWKGENPTPTRATEVRLLWTPEMLFLRFVAKYQSLNVYADARNDGWRDQLWNRDVAEVFLQPDGRDALSYKEIEVAPNGFWIDLDISHGAKEELRSGLIRRMALDKEKKVWTAELAIPMRALTANFNASREWRVNFYRVEGEAEPRFYSAWSPTYSDVPNFHVPSAFGQLIFREK